MEILPQLLINSLITGSIYALASSGMALSYGSLRILNFAHGQIMMLGAYLFFWLSIENGSSLVQAAFGTTVSAALLAVLSFQIFIAPFYRLGHLLPFITTFALGVIIESAVSMIWGVNVRSLGLYQESIQIGTIFITPLQVIIVTSALILLVVLAFIMHRSSFGRVVRAMVESPYAVQAMGVDTNRLTMAVFVFGSLCATYAGILVGYETNLQPTMGASYTIKAFAAMILGGLGNLWGTVIGAYILGLVENLGIGLDFGGYSLPAGYRDAFSFMIILAVLLIRPQGLFAIRSRKA